MRLRNIAITVGDNELCKQHAIPSIQPTEALPWEGDDELLENCLTLVAGNRQAVGINGKRLAAAAPSADGLMNHSLL